MNAANGGANTEMQSQRNRRLEMIKTVDTLPKTDFELVDYLCSSLDEQRHYENSRAEYVNLLTCVTQNFLTIISGAPGSGKTSICNILAKTMGLSDFYKRVKDKSAWGNEIDLANRYLPVSVERGWNSKRDFIGYFNPLTRNFESTDPHRYECFIELEAEFKDNYISLPYLILLDEANLSPMEYYFADFMNICDTRSQNSTISLSGNERYHIPDNLRFLATINNDHTTDRLSPRLLDRSFIITLPGKGEQNESNLFEAPAPVNFDNLKKAFNVPGRAPENILKIYGEIEKTMEHLNVQLSYRCNNAVHRYITAAAKFMRGGENKNISENESHMMALDYAVAQKVLPQIDILGEQYEETLNNLLRILENNHLSKSASVVSRILKNGSELNDYRFFKF